MDLKTYRVPPGWIQRHTEFLQDGSRDIQSSSRRNSETYRVPPGWIQRHTQFLQDGSRGIQSFSRMDSETYRVPPGWIQRHTEFLQEGSVKVIYCAATLKCLASQLAVLFSHSLWTPSKPVSALTQLCQASGSAVTREPIS